MTKKLRRGYTTGTCAQAATKAAVTMLLGNVSVDQVTVSLPEKEVLTLKISEAQKEFNKYNKSNPEIESVSCAVRKDSGDDPDITNGILVYSKVSRIKSGIVLDGGIGVGRVTKPGLDQPVGNAAINRVPRQMILREVEEACEKYGYDGGIKIEISIPQGVELAKKTFNPRLGIEGGISVLGTSGIVEPMSEQALLDTIELEMKVRRAGGKNYLIMAPGNYGLDFLREAYGIQDKDVVKCSNYIGQSMDMAADCKFQGLLLAGHIGKLIKVSGGVMNTHSRWADCRMDLLATAMLRAGFSADRARAVLDCVTTDDALALLSEEEREATIGQIMRSIEKYMEYRMADQMPVGAILYSNVYGILGKTSKVDTLMHLWEEENQ